ncbi:MAG TPA: vitamin K epoxide reductase family protein [Candidatus Gastranaerophilales bacterium]|nr:vitamin K epoxide reductase family protein [Candidatus Gastranaerophilales bacterium]
METDLNKLNRFTFVIVAIAGIIMSISLLQVYYNTNFNPAAGPSFCAINEYLDCDAVAQSEYSRFLGVPFALWGLGFYILVLIISIFPFNKFELFKKFKHPKSYIFTLATFSMILSFILLYISMFIIEKACILCQNLYLTNATFFILAKLGGSFKELYVNTFVDLKNILSDKRWQAITGISVLIGVIFLVLINIYTPFTPKKSVNQITSENYYKLGEIGNVLGAENAKLVIQEYTDYECPFCAISNQMMLRLSKEVPEIRIEHHDYPLDTKCNPYIKVAPHQNSCLAIYYAKAAKKQGKFWDMGTLMFENKENLSEENLLKLAEKIGLDVEQLKEDVKNTEIYNEEIKQDLLKAESLNINGTPTYVIGIKKIEGILPYEELKQKVVDSL